MSFLYEGVQTKAHFSVEIKSLGDERKTYQFIITSEAIDRHGDIVRMSGANLDAFKKNPVVLYQHNSNAAPIGRAVDIELRANQIVAEVEFHGKTEESRLVRDLVELGYMRTVSIGFVPRKITERNATDVEKAKLPAWRDTITEFESWDLLEFSVVTIPANPEAIILNSINDTLQNVSKAGKVLSKTNYAKLKAAHDAIGEVLAKVETEEEEEEEKGENDVAISVLRGNIETLNEEIKQEIELLKEAIASQREQFKKFDAFIPKKFTLKD
jgi:uncharacterized protein